MDSINVQKAINLSSESKGDLISLPFDIKKSCTSQDPLYPITNLKERNNSNNGWVSQKLCSYPQKIIIKFEKYVNIKQINLVINETKIPKIIQFINCIKISENSILNKNEYKYQNIGYIKLSENVDTNYQSRESRKVLLNINKTNRVKLLIHENYQNSFNNLNQVGIVSLEFIGNYVNEDESDNNEIYKINEKDNESYDEEEEKNMEDEEEEKNNDENDKEKNDEENAEKAKEEEKNNHEKDINNNSEKSEKNEKENSKNNENNKNIEKNVVIKRKSILKNRKIILKEASTLTNIRINQNYKNKYEDKKGNEENLYYNSNKYISNNINNNININSYDNNEPIKKEEKDNKINLPNYKIENMIKEKLKKLNESNEKTGKNQEYTNEFIKLQNEINNLKKMLNKIYNIKIYKESEKNNELTPQKKYYLKLRTINDGKVNTKIQSQQNILTPLIRNKTVKNNERSQLRNASINLNKKFKINQNPKGKVSLKNLSSDSLVLLTIKNKSNQKNKYEENKNNSSQSENFSIDEGNDFLEELSPEIREENEFLINNLGEEIIQKIFSKNMEYKEEGFNLLNLRVKDFIVFSPENINETNDYIISLINIVFLFIDDKHSSIVIKCLELFMNIIKSIEEKSDLDKIEYEFKITKPLIKKIIEKFNNNSKKVREKVSELYFYLLDSNLCDYNSLIIELIENDVNEYFYKLNTINSNNFSPRVNLSMVSDLSHQICKYNIINKSSIMMKMNIFLKIFSNQEKFRKKLYRKKFPESIVGDFLIMNLNNQKEEEVVHIAKNVLIKYINIFGNQIFYKLKMIIGNKELLRIIEDNDELIFELKQYEEERNKKDKKIKNMLSNLKINKLNPLSPLRIGANHFNKKNTFKFEQIKLNQINQQLKRVSSLPKLDNLKKMKLKPIKASFYMNDSISSIENNTQNKGLLYLKKNI